MPRQWEYVALLNVKCPVGGQIYQSRPILPYHIWQLIRYVSITSNTNELILNELGEINFPG